jgi:hypothetical protein
MTDFLDTPEAIWEALLSRNPSLVRKVFRPLDAADRVRILAHLRRMVSEEGWHPEQRKSAQAALKALKAEGA